MKSIYTVFVVCLNDEGTDYQYSTSVKGNKIKLGSRTWGWYEKFEDAEEVILKNLTDIFEYSYNYACIEEVPEGILTIAKVVQWYKADFNVTQIDSQPYPEVSKCDPPPYANHGFN